MTIPSENRHPDGALDDRLIDRLVDAELRDIERRDLLLRLETEPDGWRRCALAFLEAQTWRETFRPLAAAATGAARPVVTPRRERSTPNLRRFITHLTAIAAGLVAAFALGRAWHGKPADNLPHVPIASVETSASEVTTQTPRPAPVDVAVRDSRLSGREESSALLDPMVKQWEQRGFRAERQNRLVSFELKDGKKLEVPVHEVRLQYVRGRTY